MDAIMKRKSVRNYKPVPVEDDLVEKLLRAAMQAPSAGNQQPWEFVVIRDREIMKAITEFHPYSGAVLKADVLIVVCGNLSKTKFDGFWVQDCSAATENLLVEAESLSLGAVWLGVYPLEDRVAALSALLDLPSDVIPLCIVPVGYPDREYSAANRFDPSRIHLEKWTD